MAELSQKQLDILAYTLLGEAAGEGREGMEAVMWTIKNRAESGRYPSNPAAVATQANSKGVHQYSVWNTKSNGGNSPDKRFSQNDPEFKEAIAIVQRVMAGEVKDPTGGATHFYAEGSAKPAWFDAEGPAGEIAIGKHRFAARNSASQVDAATSAADAASLLGEGRIKPRPQNPIPYAPEPTQTPDSELKTRVVKTVEIDPLTGSPVKTSEKSTASQAPARLQPSAPSREVVRLRELQSTRNTADRVGDDARFNPNNAAAADKTSRARPSTYTPDRVGAAARTGTPNAASADKQTRAGSQAARLETIQPSVPALGKTPDQIAQEADNARLSGYRDIQELGPSSKGAPVKPAVTPKGTVKTAGTVTSTGTKLPQAGDTQLPKGVVPKVEVADRPRPVTTFIKRPVSVPLTPEINTRVVPAAEPAKRLVVDKPFAGRTPALPVERSNDKVLAEQRAEQSLLRRGAGKKLTSIVPAEPTVEQVISVQDTRPRGPKGRRPPAAPVVLGTGQIIAQPQTQPVIQRLLEAATSYTTTQFQMDRFQTVAGQQMPSATDNDRWKTGYETAPKPSNSNPASSWHWW